MLFSNDPAAFRMNTGGAAPPEPFARLASHLLTYKYKLAAAAVLGFVVSGLVLCFLTPRYEAEAVVIVDSRRHKLADAESELTGIVVDQYQTALKSELQLFLSPELARHVITRLGLLDTAEYKTALTHVSTAARFAQFRATLLLGWQRALALTRLQPPPAVDQGLSRPAATDSPAVLSLTDDVVMQNAVQIFERSFWAYNEPKSLTIRLGYRSESPELAAKVTNTALQEYLEGDEAIKSEAVQRSEAWLKERIIKLRADLDEADRAVEAYRAAHDVATLRERSPLQAQLAELKTRQVAARAELSAAQAKVVTNHGADDDTISSSSDVMASRLMQSLRQQEASLLAEQAQLSATMLPNNPALIKVNSQIARIRTAIRGETDRVVRSNATDQRLAEIRLSDLTAQIQSVETRINAANGSDVKLRSLEADAAAKRAVLDNFMRRYDENAGSPLTSTDGRVVSWASVPVDESSPKYGLTLVGGTMGFAFGGFCLSLLNERRRRGFTRLAELEDELGLLTAGLTPALPRRSMTPRRLRAGGDPTPMRELSLTVRALAHTPKSDRTYRTMLVTSSIPGEGKSTTALSLARSVASAGQRCLLIDADIRDPSLHRTLGLPATPGLVELTIDQAPLESVIRDVDGEGFVFLPAGRPTRDVLSPFTGAGFAEMFADLKRIYDVIVIDSAPVLLAPEGLVLAGLTDLTLFVVKWRTTPREIVQKSAQLLTRSSAGPVVAALSQVNLQEMRRSGTKGVEDQYRKAYQSH
jgi:capsular exopolysaccharide synthesis family protein